MAACEKVRAGQTHEGEAGAVCTAADGLDDRSDAAVQHGLFCQIDDFHAGFDLGKHIVVLVCQFQFDAVAVLFILFIDDGLDERFSFFERCFIEITDDIIQLCICGRTFEGAEVEETFITFCFAWDFVSRQQGCDFCTDQSSIDHNVFGCAGVYVFAVDFNKGACCVEVFIFQFANAAAIQSIGKVCAESFYVKEVNAFADFFIGSESDANVAMRDFWMGHEVFHGSQNFSNTGFVIGTQKSRAICSDEGLTDIIF